jgi:hypothetical protein
MKLCIEGDIYFIPKFHILETGTVKLSIETDLTIQTLVLNFEELFLVFVPRDRKRHPK